MEEILRALEEATRYNKGTAQRKLGAKAKTEAHRTEATAEGNIYAKLHEEYRTVKVDHPIVSHIKVFKTAPHDEAPFYLYSHKSYTRRGFKAQVDLSAVEAAFKQKGYTVDSPVHGLLFVSKTLGNTAKNQPVARLNFYPGNAKGTLTEDGSFHIGLYPEYAKHVVELLFGGEKPLISASEMPKAKGGKRR